MAEAVEAGGGHFEAPNLDCLMPEDLAEVAGVLAILATYAAQKVQAMSRRATGDTVGAVRIEQRLDRMYKTLPEAYQW